MRLILPGALLLMAAVRPVAGQTPQEGTQAEECTAFEEGFDLQASDSLGPNFSSESMIPPLRWHSMLSNIPGDWVGTTSMVFSGESLPAIGGVALSTGVLLLGDHATYTASHDIIHRSVTLNSASNLIMRLGDGRTTVGISALFALYGFAGNDSRALRTASESVEALLASGLVVQVLKHVSGRESPQAATGLRGTWRPFPALDNYNHNQARYYSFPSGHMTTAMATLTVIAENYPEAQWIRPTGYGALSLLAVSLVNKGWHWYSDFPMAIALGYSFGKIAAHHESDDVSAMDAHPSQALRVLPTVTPAGPGLMFALSF